MHFALKKHYLFGVLCKTEGQMVLDRITFCFRKNNLLFQTEYPFVLDRMNIKTYFNDRFLNALSRDDVLGGTYTLLYNDLWKCTGEPICWVGKTENVKRNGSEENNTCSFAL